MFVAVLMTETVPLPTFVTYAYLPSGVKAMLAGLPASAMGAN